MKHQISQQTFNEAKQLVEEGDTDLAERRATFKRIAGRDTTLDDDALTVATMTDDADDREFHDLVIKIEQHGYEVSDLQSA